MIENYWKDYLHLIKARWQQNSLTKLCKEANIKVPFEEGTIKEIMEYLDEKLDSVDVI
mgnify:CR=1 FL=1